VINGKPNGGPDLAGLRFIIWLLFATGVAGLLYVLNHELGGALWPF
jgi:hypothetical protein